MIPASILEQLNTQLGQDILSVESVFGGDINKAAKIQRADGKQYFLKWNADVPADVFSKEASGLDELRKAESGFKIPEVILFDQHFLLLEWLNESCGKANSAFKAGQCLARLHQQTAPEFGFHEANYIGRLEQSNRNHRLWADFYVQERIETQLQLAVSSKKMKPELLNKLPQLHQNVQELFPAEAPSLLHGDLWSGNFMYTKDSDGSVYDPAVYYGHREMDLAMTRLFGGFPSDFYRGYNSLYPVKPGFEERVTLCKLYPILVHANLFGGSYIRQAEQILLSYT